MLPALPGGEGGSRRVVGNACNGLMVSSRRRGGFQNLYFEVGSYERPADSHLSANLAAEIHGGGGE